MSHVLTYLAHADKARGFAVIGTGYLHDLAVSDLCPAGAAVISDAAGLAELSQTSMQPVSYVHLRGATTYLSVHDIPTLGRLLKVYDRVVLTGTYWADSEVEQWWSKSSTRKILDSEKMSTKTARRLLQQWVAQVSGLSLSMALHACEQVRFDPELAVPLARKVAVFDGQVTGSGISLLAQDFQVGDFVEHLLQMRGGEALAAARTLSDAQCRQALAEAAHTLPLLSRVNAAVLVHSVPNGEASRSSRLPTTTLGKYWQVAGRYTPQDVLYRLDLLRYLTESPPRNYSSLVSLVAMW